MAVKSSGPLSLSDLAAEFGGSPPYSLSQYYRGGGRVPDGPAQNAQIPTSGAISLSQFYGSVRAFTMNHVVDANMTNYDLRWVAVNWWGWDQATPLLATVTINSGVIVSSNNTGVYAFDTGSGYPAGSSLVLVNNGYIVGMGGAGGVAPVGNGGPGGAGGPALIARHGLTVYNYNTIAGGGGGGGGGGSYSTYQNTGEASGYEHYQGGGSGGGGRTGATTAPSGATGGHTPGASGIAGTFASQGGGGAMGGSYGPGSGGAGGAWGAAGAGGGPGVRYWHPDSGYIGSAYPGGAGGAGGIAVAGNSSITWVATGTRYGAIT